MREIAELYINMGNQFYVMGELEQADNCFKKAFGIIRKMDEPEVEKVLHFNLALTALYCLDDGEKAGYHLKQFRKLAKRAGPFDEDFIEIDEMEIETRLLLEDERSERNLRKFKSQRTEKAHPKGA